MQKIPYKQLITFLCSILIVTWSSSFCQEPKIIRAVPIEETDASNVCESARLFESIEVELLGNLHSTGVAVYTPNPDVANSTYDYKISLNLGVAVADAISSIVNKDKATFLKYAAIIHDYGERLGVEETILGQYNSITKTVSRNEWLEVENLIYDLKDDITTELHNEDMQSDATLAMVSGWIEGLFIVAKSLENNVSEEANRLLRNRDFVRYLTENLNTIDEDLKNKKEIKAIFAALPKIDKIINKPMSYSFTKEDVKKVLEIAEPLRYVMIADKTQ